MPIPDHGSAPQRGPRLMLKWAILGFVLVLGCSRPASMSAPPPRMLDVDAGDPLVILSVNQAVLDACTEEHPSARIYVFDTGYCAVYGLAGPGNPDGVWDFLSTPLGPDEMQRIRLAIADVPDSQYVPTNTDIPVWGKLSYTDRSLYESCRPEAWPAHWHRITLSIEPTKRTTVADFWVLEPDVPSVYVFLVQEILDVASALVQRVDSHPSGQP